MPASKHKVTDNIRKYLPNFCWQTMQEVISFFEQIDEDCSDLSVRRILHVMAKNGEIDMRLRPCQHFRTRGPKGMIAEYRNKGGCDVGRN